nr:uncharacterized protein LOC111503507 isoform X1 [Leptinotarsa decemlineata]
MWVLEENLDCCTPIRVTIMNKTPISILQEYLVQQKKALPTYTDEISDLPEYNFKCTVRFENTIVSGYANAKKEAKQRSAQLALQKMGLVNGYNNTVDFLKDISNKPMTSTNRCLPCENFIGQLNELASAKAKPYPSYEEGLVAINGQFWVKCQFLEWKSLGYGNNKKSAKQNAAKGMLEILKDKTIPINSRENLLLNSEKMENINKLCEAALRKYKELTIEEKQTPSPQTILPKPNLRPKVFSLEELQSELRLEGHDNSIETFQRDPFVMMLKIKGTNCRIMGQGTTKEEACEDLLNSAVLMFNNGFSFVASS